MAAKKYKRLTQREKELNKIARQRLREEGILPPKKAPLNRRKFATEVLEEYKNTHVDWFNISIALGVMLPYAVDISELKYRVSSEEVGVLKLVKIALELQKCNDKNMTILDAMDNIVKPIKHL